MSSDAELREMIREAYRDLDMRTPLEQIAGRPPARHRRWVALAAAAAVGAVLVGIVGPSLLPEGPERQPGDAPPSASAPPSAPGKPPRPTSSATTAAGRCADYARQEYGDTTALPPLRFDVALSDASHRLLLFADERLDVQCWLTPDRGTVAMNTSNLTANRPAHAAGRLSNSSSANGEEPFAAYSFGRVPDGTTRVEVRFPDRGPIVARLTDGWYLATATGDEAQRFADITEIVAYGPGGSTTLPVTHG